MKTHHWMTLVVAALIVGSILIWPKFQSKDLYTDELTGTWRANATPDAEYVWWIEYVFEDRNYTLTTDSYYKEEGTYTITERFLDGSMLVKKTFSDGSKEYEMTVVPTEDPDIILIEGAQLKRVSE